jgi:rubrerythrin
MKLSRKEKFTTPRTPAEVLKLALAREKASFSFYQKLAKREIDPGVKKVFLKMKEQELCHIRYLKNLLTR